MTPSEKLKKIEDRLTSIDSVVKHVDVWSAYAHDVGYLFARVKRLEAANEAREFAIEKMVEALKYYEDLTYDDGLRARKALAEWERCK